MNRDWKGERDWWLGPLLPMGSRTTAQLDSNPSDLLRLRGHTSPLQCAYASGLAVSCMALGPRRQWIRLPQRKGELTLWPMSIARGVDVQASSSILHLCHRPFCVQPAHLYEGTAKENSEDRKALNTKGWSYPTWGHDWGPAREGLHRAPVGRLPPWQGQFNAWTRTRPWTAPTPSYERQEPPGCAPTAPSPAPTPSSTDTGEPATCPVQVPTTGPAVA